MRCEKDRLGRFLFDEIGIRGELIRLDQSFRTLLKGHDYPLPVAIQLGEAFSASLLLSATVKLNGLLILQIAGDGPMSMLVTQARNDRTARGLARYSGEIPGDADFTSLVGNGHMVITIDAKGTERYQGIVELNGKTIADCLQAYFSRSEQLPTRLWLVSDGERAAGLLLQQMPSEDGGGENWERLQALADTVSAEELLELPFETLLYRLFHEERVKVFDTEPVAFRCGCSREKIEAALLSMGREEAGSLIAGQGVINANCDFCMTAYQLDSVDVEALFRQALPPQKGQ